MNTPLIEQTPIPELRAEHPAEAVLWRKLPHPLSGVNAASAGLGLTVIATGLGAALTRSLPLHSVALVYLLAVVVAAVALGVRTGLSVAAFAFLAYNFFFIPPVYTLTIADPSELFALFVFLVVAVLTGSLAGRLRDAADAANRRATALQAQNEFAQVLTAARDEPAILDALTKQTAIVTDGNAVVLIRNNDAMQSLSASGQSIMLSSADFQAAQRAIRSQKVVPAVATGWPGARFEFWPISMRLGVTGALGFTTSQQRQSANDEIISSVQASVRLASIALERTRLHDEAEAARAETERERLRAVLIASLSHDLRTPLASILGAVTSLRQFGESLDKETRADLLVAIEEETSRLARFVTNLLDMTRLESTTIDLKNDWLDVSDVVQTAVSRARRIAPERSILLNSPVSVPPVRGDATLSEHVIFNILDNAIKFSTVDDSINVEVSVVGRNVQVAILDHGRGIPPDALRKVFMPFYRVRSGDGFVPGTGLGLAIGQRVIEGMGGTIAIASPTDAGRGTCVTVSVPFAIGDLEQFHDSEGAER